jgi:hypothetical protein
VCRSSCSCLQPYSTAALSIANAVFIGDLLVPVAFSGPALPSAARIKQCKESSDAKREGGAW